MKCSKIFRIVTVVALLSGGLVFISGAPALAGPEIKLSAAEGAVGTVVTVTGENFDSYKGDALYLYFDNDEIGASPIIVPQTGNFEFILNIPEDAEPGEHIIRVKNKLGSVYSTVALSAFNVLKPDISLSSRSGAVGKKLVVEGEGFYADRVVAIYFDTVILVTLTASSTGAFSYSFNVPNTSAGAHTIVAKNDKGDSARSDFDIIAQIIINPLTGPVGSVVSVEGNGFDSRSDVSIFFQYDEVAYARTDKYGAFSLTSFNVPQVPPGTYEIIVRDEGGNTAKYGFTIIAGVTMDRTTTSVGGELTLTGTGFEANTEVDMQFDGAAVATITADSSGAFRIVFKVPASKHGEHVITLSDGLNTREVVFEVESEAPPAPVLLSPEPRSEVKATTYFDWEDVDDPSSPVSYRLQVASGDDFADLIMDKVLTESEYTLGEKEALAAVTEGSPYYARVKAIDGAANESEWSAAVPFLVLAPPAPSLLLPENSGEADAQVFFDWADVKSLNPPVMYHLQVAQTEDFSKLVMEKKGLAASEYSLVKEEKLAAVKKDAPYYWRVRAVDGAGNEGQWSAPNSFTVGFYLALPGWVIYTLIAIGAVIIGFLAFWLGRRTAYGET